MTPANLRIIDFIHGSSGRVLSPFQLEKLRIEEETMIRSRKPKDHGTN